MANINYSIIDINNKIATLTGLHQLRLSISGESLSTEQQIEEFTGRISHDIQTTSVSIKTDFPPSKRQQKMQSDLHKISRAFREAQKTYNCQLEAHKKAINL